LILRTTSGGEPVTLVENENQSPYSFELFQNYPNPFNPSTKIKFIIPASPKSSPKERTFTTLKVYDILGNEVATLVNEEFPAGEYEIEFNVAQVSRPEISSGVYFYQLKIGGPETSSGQVLIQTKKMVYLK
jgi:hypothetical protein